MKLILWTLLSALAMPAISHAVIEGTRGGSFVDYRPLPILMELKEDLTRRVRVLPESAFTKLAVPKNWTPERVARTIEKLKVDSSPQSLRIEGGGRLKLLNFSRRDNSISVLAAFFLYYGRDMGAGLSADTPIRDEIRVQILHEVAHLWGANDDVAEHFAQRVLWDINHDLLTCNVTAVVDGKGTDYHFAYDFGSSQFYIFSQHIGMSDDDGMPSVDDGDWSMSAAGSVSFSKDEVTVVEGRYKMTAGLAVDKEYVSAGVFEAQGDFDTLNVPAQKVRCMVGVPRGPVADDDED